MKKRLALLFFITGFCVSAQSFDQLCSDFVSSYNKLGIPGTDLDYKVNFKNIGGDEDLKKQEVFFREQEEKFKACAALKLNSEKTLRLKQIRYEIELNEERISLEKGWIKAGRPIPEKGLFGMKEAERWYRYYVKLFTSTSMKVEDVHSFGMSEVKRIQKEIDSLRIKLKFENESEFYSFLRADTFFLSDKSLILSEYNIIDATVRKNLEKYFPALEVPEVGIMEWPNAGKFTPPGMYLSHNDNPYGKDVFQFNFHLQKHNRRSMEWLYMHEAIPGHHLQSVFRNKSDSTSLSSQFFYFGNAEGWACYIEDLGKNLGLYESDFTYLGKLEWDLVRSARLVMETGIHYYGWSYEKAMQYWKENINGQDEIAEREITRITNWPGQALCYKVGALYIKKIAAATTDLKKAHEFLLKHSDFPLEVLM
jgi:uncharacterized protein (DUF885 family)